MSKAIPFAAGIASFVAVMAPALTARAQCCPGYSLATACANVTLTKSRWCIQDTVPTGQAALPQAFCAYGDKVVSTLESTFNIQAPDIFEFELDTATGGAHTGTACNNFGDGAAYDGFTGNAYNATGFWGYLLAMHEAINDWTGLSSSGWPTDWWADHQSAFPNLMDFHIMNKVGTEDNDNNLITAAAAQKKRFYPGGDSSDAKVVALDNVYMAMPNGDGFAGFSHMFALQSGDGVKWDSLGVPNPDVKRSEYVAAYMSLATGKSVLPLLQGPGANGGGNICNNTPDGTQGDAPYTCSEAHIDAIATAHCSIAANDKPSADLSALKAGNYSNIASGPCGSSCPSECACDSSNHCVAPWLGTPQTTGGSGGSAGGSSTAGSGGTSSNGGATSRGGASSSGGANGVTTNGGAASSTGGATSTTGGAAAGTTSNAGSASLAGNNSGGSTDSSTDNSKGCSCSAAGQGRNNPLAGLFLASALAGLALARAHSRQRSTR